MLGTDAVAPDVRPSVTVEPDVFDEVDARLARLFGLVAQGLAAATDAFLSGDRDAAASVRRVEVLVDQLHDATESLIDEQVLTIAGGLDGERLARVVLALRIAPQLERGGDLVEHIAARASSRIAADLPPSAMALVRRMGDLSLELWNRAAAIFGSVDNWGADELRALDDELDDVHVQLCEELAGMPLSVPVAIDLGLVARFYERLGDHAVHIARRVESHDRMVGVVS